MQNHFDLFQLPQQFMLDVAMLDAAYRDVQGKVHPDRFAQASEAEKRVAMQWATRANEAYQTLKNPMKRAAYLCELNGCSLDTESNTAMPAVFLVQQMEWREALQDARADRNRKALEALETEWRQARKLLTQRIESQLGAEDYSNAAQGVRQWMFLDKFGEELRAAFDAMGV